MFKAHRLVYHSTPGSRVTKKKKKITFPPRRDIPRIAKMIMKRRISATSDDTAPIVLEMTCSRSSSLSCMSCHYIRSDVVGQANCTNGLGSRACGAGCRVCGVACRGASWATLICFWIWGKARTSFEFDYWGYQNLKAIWRLATPKARMDMLFYFHCDLLLDLGQGAAYTPVGVGCRVCGIGCVV